MTENLEKLAKRKNEISPTVEKAIESLLGTVVPQISDDISNKIIEGNIDFPIELNLGFKKAKEQFKKNFIVKLLNTNNGNVAESARTAGLDRRTLHRLIKKFRITLDSLRKQPYFFRNEKKDKFVKEVIEEVLEKYDLTRGRYEANIETAHEISSKIPELSLAYDEAVELFEKEFIKKALEEYKTQKEAAKAIGLRYETLHKKAKIYGLT